MDRLFSPSLLVSLLIFIIFTFLIFCSLIGCSVVAAPIGSRQIKRDESSLLAFKSLITSDPHNLIKNSWTAQTSVCSWIGVTCDSSHSRVTGLNISSMEVVGRIPPEIGNLSSLVSLDLSSNFLHGPVPSTVFNMTPLEYIFLNNNSLSGGLPKDICRYNKHQRLKGLVLFMNKMEGEIPPSLGQCSLLEVIYLSRNNFGGEVPREIGNITQLKKLYISWNNLRGPIPSWVGMLSNLEELGLSSNKLNGAIPSTMGNLSSLMYLSLSSNKLNGELPSSFCNFTSLEFLLLSNNSLEGTIPQCFGNSSISLLIFHLHENYFNGLIPSIFIEGCSLLSIKLNDNKLEGRLPTTLINCKSLLGLDVGNNMINDTFPFWMEDGLPELRLLILRSNMFHGSMLSRTYYNKLPFRNLQVLDVSRNAFVGSLPDRYFQNFKEMIEINENETSTDETFLNFVEMTLTIKGLDQVLKRLLAALTTIDLSSNGFSGSIPHSLGNLNSLKYLNLSHNRLIQSIPPSLGNMIALESLDLSSNKMDGEIPSELTRLTFLSKLNLSMNNLKGEIPRLKQFSTFENDSYVGNRGLCGVPLMRKCNDDDVEPPEAEEEGDDDGFSWRSVVMGYGSGFIVGIGIGWGIARYGRPRWLVELFFGVGYQYGSKMTRRKRGRVSTTQRRSR